MPKHGGRTSGPGSDTRPLAVRVRSARRRKPSSTEWLNRQLNDPYVAEAHRLGYRSRAAFKLLQLDERFRLLRPGTQVVDLGCAPGGWTQIAARRVGPQGRVVGIDLSPTAPVERAALLAGDFRDPDTADNIRDALGGPADLVLSDMAAPATGHAATDHLRIVALAEDAFAFAETILKPGGAFVAKVLQGGAEGELLAALKRAFAEVRHAKPAASRAESAETYVVAKGFRGAPQGRAAALLKHSGPELDTGIAPPTYCGNTPNRVTGAMEIRQALTFDDVMLVPAASSILPAETDTRSRITREIELGIPLISAAMDTVTEGALAIAMAQAGGLGVIHRNMPIESQAAEVRKVKKFEAGMVVNPVTIDPHETLADALKLMADHKISGIPVVERAPGNQPGRLCGILTNRDVRFASDPDQPVSELMTHDGLVTVRENVGKDEAKRLLHQHRIEKLLVVDDAYRCVGLITVKDIEKAQLFPHAAKDEHGRLRVAAAAGTGHAELERAEALFAAGVDIMVVDTAHGHSQRVLDTVNEIRRMSNYTQLIVGNIATAEGARALIEAGADAVKVGIGPGSICTTRMVAGVGVPQFTAIVDAVEECRKHGVPVIADGGIKFSGDLAKAIAAGADCAMLGSLFAGTDESPGEVFLYQGRSYKYYRGMGSIGAMARGSADRYFQQEVTDTLKLVPEGVEGRVAHKGPVGNIVHQLIGGLRAAMGYTGCRTIPEMQRNCRFVRITGAGLRESHVHDIAITREAPNYRQDL